MGLKAFTFLTTRETGHHLPMYLVFRTLIVDNDQATATLIFQGYSSQAERTRQVEKKENSFYTFNLILSGIDYLVLFTRQTNGFLGLEISDIVWELAQNKQFIPDYEVNNEGLRLPVGKSLNDLNAVEIDLPLEMNDEITQGVGNRAAELFTKNKTKK